jgi:hypothetical protein
MSRTAWIDIVACIVCAAGWGCGHREPQREPQPAPSGPTESAMTSDTDKLDQCLRTIDDKPDPGHSDHTPSVRCLIEIGRPALVPVIGLL